MKNKKERYKEAVERNIHHALYVAPKKYLAFSLLKLKIAIGIKKEDTTYDKKLTDFLKK